MPKSAAKTVSTRRWYEANRELVAGRDKARHTKRRNEIRQFLTAYLQEHPCIDCGESDPVVLDFDHVGEKSFNIARAVTNSKPLSIVAAEIEQCVVRCANCHRRKTYQTRGYRSRNVAALREPAAIARKSRRGLSV